jgi:23S rRNA (uridine2552-2'-O)-methyltransferase
MSRSKSSGRWLKEHFDDEFVRRAQVEGWRSRGVFKLEEIDQKDHLLGPGKLVVDLGAAPGGWSQYARRKLGHQGRVVALDCLPMEPEAGVEMIQGDFCEQATLDLVLSTLGESRVDVLLSDMAPNLSGTRAIDQPRAMYLAELALELAQQILKPGGDLLVKVFHGEGFDEYLRSLRRCFGRVYSRKPKASRSRSRELYLLARNYGM